MALLAVAFWPRWGVYHRVVRRLATTDRMVAEDILKHLFHGQSAGLPDALGIPARRIERAVSLLVSRGLVTGHAPDLSLTVQGREHAIHLVRAHRLWERYLADRTGVDARDWHEQAELAEHRLTPAETARLSDRMGRPAFDPHGDPIPSPEGVVRDVPGRPLMEVEPGTTVEIAHIEDEPRHLYESLLAAGLAPGERLTVNGRGDADIEFIAAGQRTTLSAAAAANVTVADVRGAVAEVEHRTLASIATGHGARVIGLAPACIGAQRRRLLDLGLVPGTEVIAEMKSAMGDPVAYRVRGALIALRRHQADWIIVEPLGAVVEG